MSNVDYFKGLGVRVNPLSREEFLRVRETLPRVGLLEGENVLEQICYILHKRGTYAILHHKEMRMLDGEDLDLTKDEEGVRNTIAFLLSHWGIVKLDDPNAVRQPRARPGSIKVIPHKEKANYVLKPLYVIGTPK